MDECFFVDEISGGSLLDAIYEYHLICPQKLPDDEPQQPQHEKNWYFVGASKGSEAFSRNMSSFSYRRIKQSVIKLVFLDDTMVNFVTGLGEPDYKIIFQSFQQSRAFYKALGYGVNMSEAVRISMYILTSIMYYSRLHTRNVQSMTTN